MTLAKLLSHEMWGSPLIYTLFFYLFIYLFITYVYFD